MQVAVEEPSIWDSQGHCSSEYMTQDTAAQKTLLQDKYGWGLGLGFMVKGLMQQSLLAAGSRVFRHWPPGQESQTVLILVEPAFF